MSITSLKYQIEEAASQISSIGEELGELEELEEAMEAWADIEHEFGPPDSIQEDLHCFRGIREVFESLGYEVWTPDSVAQAIDEMKDAGPQGSDEILTAIKLLVSALTGAGVLPGTEVVPTPVSTEEPAVADNVVSAAPSLTNQTNN